MAAPSINASGASTGAVGVPPDNAADNDDTKLLNVVVSEVGIAAAAAAGGLTTAAADEGTCEAALLAAVGRATDARAFGVTAAAAIGGVSGSQFDCGSGATDAAGNSIRIAGASACFAGSLPLAGGNASSVVMLRPLAARGTPDIGICEAALAAPGCALRGVPLTAPDRVVVRGPEFAACDVEESDPAEGPFRAPASALAVAHVPHNPVASAPAPTARARTDFLT